MPYLFEHSVNYKSCNFLLHNNNDNNNEHDMVLSCGVNSYLMESDSDGQSKRSKVTFEKFDWSKWWVASSLYRPLKRGFIRKQGEDTIMPTHCVLITFLK